MLKQILFIIFACISVQQASASSLCLERGFKVNGEKDQVDIVFEREFFNTLPFVGTYNPEVCYRNVKQLIHRLGESVPGFNLQEANVLLIKSRSSLFITYKPRSISPNYIYTPQGQQSFGFHVVLEYRGKIYDLEYGESPRPMLIKEYFQDMYSPNVHTKEISQDIRVSVEAEELLINSISAERYISTYKDMLSINKFLKQPNFTSYSKYLAKQEN